MSTRQSPFPQAPAEAEWRRQSDLTKFYALFPSPALARASRSERRRAKSA